MRIKKILDLSMQVRSMQTPVFPGYPQPVRSNYTTIEREGYYSNTWYFIEHTSTHVDSPSHFLKHGMTVEKIQARKFVSYGILLDFSDVPPRYVIGKEDIVKRVSKEIRGRTLLFYTGYSRFAGKRKWFDYPEISKDAALYIASKNANAVGFDSPSPDREPYVAHKILLQKNILIYENLVNLEKLIGQEFLFVALPISLEKGSASPVRAVALVLR